MALLTARLKNLRKILHVSQKDVGAALGLAERVYRAYENAEIDPTTARAAEIADYFDVSIDYLIGRSDEPDFPHAEKT